MSATDALAQRAEHFLKLILDVATGPGGMIISSPRFDTRKPYQEGEPCPTGSCLEEAWGTFTPRPTTPEWLYGENTLWAEGWLLWSQLLQHRATGEEAAVRTARKCFHDLTYIFQLCSELEPGLLGKPHGGRAGWTTSFDQAACPVLPYVAFAQELATPEQRAEATRWMDLHGDWYLRRNWVVNHFGNLLRVVDSCHTSTLKYLACVHAAFDLTGKQEYREVAIRYVRQVIRNGKLPWPANPYETNHNLYYWALLCDYWRQTELAGEADWLGCIREYWRAAQACLDSDGIPLFGNFDTSSGAFEPYPSRWIGREDAAEWPMQAPRKVERRYISATGMGNRSLNAVSLAALALLVRSHGMDDQAHLVAQRILLGIDEERLRWWWDDGNLPDELQPVLNFFHPEVAAIWLAAYWMGRAQGVW